MVVADGDDATSLAKDVSPQVIVSSPHEYMIHLPTMSCVTCFHGDSREAVHNKKNRIVKVYNIPRKLTTRCCHELREHHACPDCI